MKIKIAMKKGIIILGVFMLVASGCKLKTTSKSLIVERNLALQLLDFPTIKDTVSFISNLKQTYNLETDIGEHNEKITVFEKVKIYGSNDDFFFVEYDYGDGCMAAYPWKFQLLLTMEGKLVKTFSAQRFDFVQIFPNQNPFLLVVVATAKGNGGHEIYKVSADTLENVYKGYRNYEVRTYDAHQDISIYEPNELNLKIKDYNNDGFNDIAFVGEIVLIQGRTKDGIWYDTEIINGDTITYSVDNPFDKIPIEFIFLYDKKTGHFKAKEDYVEKYRF